MSAFVSSNFNACKYLLSNANAKFLLAIDLCMLYAARYGQYLPLIRKEMLTCSQHATKGLPYTNTHSLAISTRRVQLDAMA